MDEGHVTDEDDLESCRPPTTFNIDCDLQSAGLTNNLWYVLSPANRVADVVPFQQTCPLCHGRNRIFYCSPCVTKGEFTHSNPRKPGALAEKRIHQVALQRRRQQLVAEIEAKTRTSQKVLVLSENVKQAKQRVKWLKSLVKDKSEQNVKTVKTFQKLSGENKIRQRRLPQFVDKVDKISRCVKQYCGDLDNERIKVGHKLKILAQHRRNHMDELARYVFPLECVDVVQSNSLAAVREDDYDVLVAEMEDAMTTSHVHGQWVTTSLSAHTASNSTNLEGEKQWRIVAPLLPATGDYTPYYALMAALSDNVGSSSSTSQDGAAALAHAIVSPIHTISGGLTLTAQFLAHLASCLDVVLPKRLSYGDFGTPTSSQYVFAKKLAKLNINVAYLCMTQGIPSKLLKPTHTLFNLSLLLNGSSKQLLPHVGLLSKAIDAEDFYHVSVVISAEVDMMKPTADDLENDSDKDDDNWKDLDDWESVPMDMMVVNPYMQHLPSSPSPPPPGVPSIASSFMSSLMRGFTSTNVAPNSPQK